MNSQLCGIGTRDEVGHAQQVKELLDSTTGDADNFIIHHGYVSRWTPKAIVPNQKKTVVVLEPLLLLGLVLRVGDRLFPTDPFKLLGH